MKKFKKLIPAFCMLLVSAVMLGSSTFAWFSMNNKVTATGLDVTAKSNTQFLVISATESLPTSGDWTTVALKKTAGSDDGVLPVSINKGNETTIYYSKEGGVTVAKDAWYTARSTKYNETGASGNSQADSTLVDVKVISDDTALNAYRLTYKAYLAIAENSEAMTGTITMTATFGNSADKSVSLRVVVNSKNYDFSNADNGTKENTTESMTIDEGDFVEVTIYVYIDGTVESVKSSEDVSKIAGSVSLAFELNIANA